MITWLIILGSIVAYLIAGYGAAWLAAPRVINYFKYYEEPYGHLDSYDRRLVRTSLIWIRFGWPGYWLYQLLSTLIRKGLALNTKSLDKLIDSRDGQTLAERRANKIRNQRIELDRQKRALEKHKQEWLTDVQSKEKEIFGEIRTTEV